MSQADFPATAREAGEGASGDFPAGGTAEDKLNFLLKYAILAPSSHNSQPWLFRVSRGAVELYADRSRALPIIDPEDRELVISCGCALFHLCVAMRYFGYAPRVDAFPDPRDQDLLARVYLGDSGSSSLEDSELFGAMLRRRTNRKPFLNQKVSVSLLMRLQAAARQHKAWMHLFDSDAEKIAVAELISEADRIQWSDRSFRREVAAWMHPNRALSADGIPGYALGLNDVMSMARPAVVRTFDLGNGEAAHDEDLAKGSPVLLAIGTPENTAQDWLNTGQALAHMLLLGTSSGVSASFLNQPVEVPELLPALQALIGEAGYPQIILRMGYGPEVKMTPRRPVEDVVI